MSTKFIQILDRGRFVRDDEPPHIDDYGFQRLDSMIHQLERLKDETDDPVWQRALENMRSYLELTLSRYDQYE